VARVITVSLDGVESSFGFKAVDRAAVYGKRRRVALDREGQPCTRASLLEDGSLLLRSGMTGQGYFLPDGTFLKQSDLEAFDDAGNPLDKVPSTLGAPQPLEGPISPSEVLDLRVETIYALDPDSVNDALMSRLDAGDLFRFAFNFRDDYRAETGVLLANENGVFALIGVPLSYEWSSLQVLVDLPAADEDSDDDDLDFEF
jgi:hypothetical protein